jgi:2-keto-4-pentenoate hydratase/2-oxohepta-3-ene-1,7-dioic acid hydratase in catechol pathway
MQLCSYTVSSGTSYGVMREDGGIVDLGRLVGDRFPTLLGLIRGDGLEHARHASEGKAADYRSEDVAFLPLYPEPVTIHCVGLNYAAHTAEAGVKQPDFPRTFFKVPASLVGHGEKLEKPVLSPEFDFEGELAVVIGKTARNVPQAQAMQYVAGYTCFMDGSVRDYQLQRTLDQGKNFFRSSSMGPCLVTADEVGLLDRLTVTTIVSGEQMQHSAFDKMIFPVPKLIEYLSAITELRPGDVIATGTPEGVGFKRTPPRYLQSGDWVEVIIDRIGRLRNEVA